MTSPPVVKNLLPRDAGRNLEVHATVVVGFVGGGEIEIGEQDLAGAARGEVKEGIAHDSVVEDLGPVTVFENEHGRRLSGHRLFGLVVERKICVGARIPPVTPL